MRYRQHVLENQFNTMLARRKANDLRKASSFDEFKEILLTPNPLQKRQSPKGGVVGGGAVFVSQSRNRSISKRSLDSSNDTMYGDECKSNLLLFHYSRWEIFSGRKRRELHFRR